MGSGVDLVNEVVGSGVVLVVVSNEVVGFGVVRVERSSRNVLVVVDVLSGAVQLSHKTCRLSLERKSPLVLWKGKITTTALFSSYTGL